MINFDPITHTYERNGTPYTSVTTLLKKYNLSPDYGNIPQEVLAKAASRGNATHKAIENYIKQGIIDPNNVDLANFIKYITAKNINVTNSIAEEVICNDTYLLAGTVDWQYTDGDDEVIADHKTTSQIHWDTVSWQLSIYNFIKCNGDIIQYYLKKLKVFHYYNGKLTVRDIPLIDYDEIINLLNANLADAPYTYTPDLSKILSHSESVMFRAILDDINQCSTLLADLNKKKEAIQETIMNRMAANNKYDCTIDNMHLTYSDTLSRKSLDIQKVKNLCDTFNIDVDTLYKVSPVKPKLTITRKD